MKRNYFCICRDLGKRGRTRNRVAAWIASIVADALRVGLPFGAWHTRGIHGGRVASGCVARPPRPWFLVANRLRRFDNTFATLIGSVRSVPPSSRRLVLLSVRRCLKLRPEKFLGRIFGYQRGLISTGEHWRGFMATKRDAAARFNNLAALAGVPTIDQ
jgi:hypothetical protein